MVRGRCSIFLYLADCQCDALSIQRFFHRIHRVGLGFFGDVDVGLNGFVVGIAGDVDGLVEAAEFADFLQILCGWLPVAGAA